MLSGKQLKIQRIIKEIQAMDIASELNVSKTYISLMEKGERKIPLHIYNKWVDILGL
ncbi:helix-turn-helix transcriptional regulator [Fictibacillus nanhaiensis]|uniref:helix-turn-helix transcriptional regulator n=1 Tax=Fictibacillus nanhaiensis TaxID=742169 RepID=UPI002E21F5B8|nr:helix-turn-helix transcriptional regulator [Fictibacillus nanhaiensis]